MVEQAVDIASAARALGDPTRLRILGILTGAELTVSEIVEILEMGQSRVSRHIKILADSSMIEGRRSGVWIFYSRSEHGPYETLVQSSLSLMNPSSDISRREGVMLNRREETTAFFNDRAAAWEEMKHRIFVGLEPDLLVAEIATGYRSIADLGCGQGRLASFLAESAEVVVGVDNSQSMLEIARGRAEQTIGLEFRLGDIEHLPMRDSEVECAILSLVLHHLPRPEEALAEAARVVAIGGSIVILEFEPHSNEELRRLHGDRWLGIEQSRIVTWLDNLNFKITKKERYILTDGIVLQLNMGKKNQRR